jgi:3-hydroxybutyryl-CoA dehydrogenase
MQGSERIAVIGAGFMGTVIATLYSRYNYNVALHDTASEMLDSYRERARPIAEILADDEKSVDQILAGVAAEKRLEPALTGAFLVHEVIQEALSAKQELFGLLDRKCGHDVIIATNTSSFLLSEIVHHVRRRDRVIGIHYVTPAHVIRAVELIYADFTPAPLIEWGRRFLATIDHIGVACKERPGFLINRLQFALLSEVYRLIDEGLASRDDIDTAVRLSLGPRLALWGPLLTEDLVVNKKTSLAVTEYLHERTGDANFAVRPVLRRLVDNGYAGAVVGKGWYDFEAPYPSVVSRRDAQLKDLLSWLRRNDPVGNIGIRQDTVGDVSRGD